MAAVGRSLTNSRIVFGVKLEQVKLRQCDPAHLLLVESIFFPTVNFSFFFIGSQLEYQRQFVSRIRCKSMIGRFIGCNQIRFLQDNAIIDEIFLSPSNHLRFTHERELSHDEFLAANATTSNSFLNSKAGRILVCILKHFLKLAEDCEAKSLVHHVSPNQDVEASPVAMESFFVLVEFWTTNLLIGRKFPLKTV